MEECTKFEVDNIKNYSLCEKTMDLQFIDGVLHQGEKRIIYRNGVPTGEELVFVKVPSYVR